MAGVSRRLRTLERRSRESAASQVRAAWEALTDREMALVLAPFFFGRAPTPEESAARSSFERGVPEVLLALAVGQREGPPEEELDRRMRELLYPVLSRRRAGVLRAMACMKGGRDAVR